MRGGGQPKSLTDKGYRALIKILFDHCGNITHINMQQNHVKNAFTLAEVLITLGIIGVVAAMTLPTLMQNAQNRELEAALKKNYSIIQQAFKLYEAENGEPLQDRQIAEKTLKPKIIKYFKVLHDCGYGAEEADSCIPNYGQSSEETFKNYKTYNNKNMHMYFFDDGQFVLMDGSLILLKNNRLGDPVYVSIDVNGHKKLPNKWGHDLFTFQLMPSGAIVPMGTEGTTRDNLERYCSVNSEDPLNGIACAYKALTEKDYFKNLPR